MIEGDPKSTGGDFSPDQLIRSKRVVNRLIAEAPFTDVLYPLSIRLSMHIQDMPDPPPQPLSERLRERFHIRPRITSADIAVFRTSLPALLAHDPAPDEELTDIPEYDDKKFNTYLKQKQTLLKRHEYEEARRRPGRVTTLAVAAGLEIAASLGVTIYNHALAAEQSQVLTTDPSVQSFREKWQIRKAEPAPGKHFVTDVPGVVVPPDEDIKVPVNGELKRTRIEIQPYTTVRGDPGIKILVPVTNPELVIPVLNIDSGVRRFDPGIEGPRLLILDTSGYVELNSPQGDVYTAQIADGTPWDSTDSVFTIAPVREEN